MPENDRHITVRAVQPVVKALEVLGYPVSAVLEASTITAEVLSDVEGSIPDYAMAALWKHALELTGDDDLGIHLAEVAPIRSFEVHSYALLSSATLRSAFQRACRYQRLIHEANDLILEENDEGGMLRHVRPGGLSVARHPAEFLVTLWVRFGRLVTGDDWSPECVCFAHKAPTDCSEHHRVFRAPVTFSTGQTAMYIRSELLDALNPRADAVLVGVMDRYAGDLLQKVPHASTCTEDVRRWLIEELKGGSPTAKDAAKYLHMSERTLHRHLKDEGASFRELLGQLRHERAARLLANPRYNVAEVAFLLGFSELSSFYRAFKRWTGKTPVEFRAEAVANKASSMSSSS